MQVDADDDEQPFFKPAVVQTEPLIPKQREARQPPPQDEPQRVGDIRGDHQEVAAAAATATAEQEE